MEHSISLTRAELQAQLDQTSELCRRLTEALRKSEQEKGELLAAAKFAIKAMSVSTCDTLAEDGLRDIVSKIEKKP